MSFDWYSFFEFLHIVAVVAWMAGMLYLPRLYVYHSAEDFGSHTYGVFSTMERRLFFYIILPASFFALVFGMILVHLGGFMASGWLHLKLALVFLMFGLEVAFFIFYSSFVRGSNVLSARVFKVINEAVTLLMIGIVYCAVMKFYISF